MLAADWVHLGTHSSDRLVRRLVADGVPFSLDVSTEPFAISLEGVPWCSPRPGRSFRPGRAVHRAAETGGGREKVVVTCGKRGSFYDDGVHGFSAGSVPVSVVDTCGAGDSFISSFLSVLLFKSYDEAAALSHAAAQASQTCTHLGGFPQEIHSIPQWLLEKYDSVIHAAHQGVGQGA